MLKAFNKRPKETAFLPLRMQQLVLYSTHCFCLHFALPSSSRSPEVVAEEQECLTIPAAAVAAEPVFLTWLAEAAVALVSYRKNIHINDIYIY